MEGIQEPLKLKSALQSALSRKEYNRPDIVVMRAMCDQNDLIKDELKFLGDEARYANALRQISKHAQNVQINAKILLDRFEAQGE